MATEPLSDAFDATILLTVAYNGAPFCGFAKQPGQNTVQGQLESACKTIFKREVQTTCAGRTDSGVHALRQKVSFDATSNDVVGFSEKALCRSMNALTSDGISVSSAKIMPKGFSARFDARWREYKYRLCTQSAPPIFMRAFSWHIPRGLDVSLMDEASRALIGEHDFKSFCIATSSVGKPTCRNVMSIAFDRDRIMGEEIVEVTIRGNAFLHSMVRTIIGTLVEVGRGNRPPEWVEEILLAADRRRAGQCAPAEGLVFWDVGYDE